MMDTIADFLGVEITTKYIIAQIIGFMGLAAMAFSFQTKSQSKIMKCQIVAGFLYVISYFLQASYTGALINLASAFRSMIYSHTDKKKWAKNIAFPIIFIIIYIAVTGFTWEAWFSLLPMCAQITSTIAYRSTNATLVRVVSFPCSLCWMVYNIIIGNVSGFACEIFVTTSVIVGFFRHDLPKLKEKHQK